MSAGSRGNQQQWRDKALGGRERARDGRRDGAAGDGEGVRSGAMGQGGTEEVHGGAAGAHNGRRDRVTDNGKSTRFSEFDRNQSMKASNFVVLSTSSFNHDCIGLFLLLGRLTSLIFVRFYFFKKILCLIRQLILYFTS